jgi:hypothetical protein
LGLHRVLDLGCYETAWQWLHKLRRAMVRPGRDQLSGVVQVDETFIGGRRKPGKGGRGAAGKALVAITVEDKSPNGIGRTRLQHIADASADSLGAFAKQMILPSSVVVTDDWSGYLTLPSFVGFLRYLNFEVVSKSVFCLYSPPQVLGTDLKLSILKHLPNCLYELGWRQILPDQSFWRNSKPPELITPKELVGHVSHDHGRATA